MARSGTLAPGSVAAGRAAPLKAGAILRRVAHPFEVECDEQMVRAELLVKPGELQAPNAEPGTTTRGRDLTRPAIDGGRVVVGVPPFGRGRMSDDRRRSPVSTPVVPPRTMRRTAASPCPCRPVEQNRPRRKAVQTVGRRTRRRARQRRPRASSTLSLRSQQILSAEPPNARRKASSAPGRRGRSRLATLAAAIVRTRHASPMSTDRMSGTCDAMSGDGRLLLRQDHHARRSCRCVKPRNSRTRRAIRSAAPAPDRR